MNMTIATGFLVVIASLIPVRLVTSAKAANAQDCPVDCPAVSNTSTTGTVPTGVTYSFLVLPESDGNAEDTACATCQACLQEASLIFNSNGTPWCIRVDVNGIGSTVPLKHYSRPGTLHADCDTSFCVYNQIVDCQTGDVTQFTELRCLNCGCGGN